MGSKNEVLKILGENFVDFLTGKQTIYQCIRLDKEAQHRGRRSFDPLEYKRGYHKKDSQNIRIAIF